MKSAEPRPFRWWAEAPWLLPPMLIAVAVRLPIIRHIVEVSHGDTAIVWLMMRRIARGTDVPLLYYGQWYMGLIDPLMAAPVSALLGPRWDALAIGQTLIFTLLALPLAYRLLHRIGGRAGAVAGASLVAFGTPWFQICTAGRYTGYLSTLWLGALFLLIGWRELRQIDGPSRWRPAVLGLIAGLGYYNNPQIVLFVAPLAIALWLERGRVPALRGEGRLVASLGRWRARWLFYTAGVLVALLAFAAFLCFKVHSAEEATKRGATEAEVHERLTFGRLVLSVGTPSLCYIGIDQGTAEHDPEEEKLIGIGSPENYPPRLIILLGLLVLLAEYWLATDRARWRGWLMIFGACGLVGYAPMIVAKLTLDEGKQQWRTAPQKINPAVIPERVEKLQLFVGLVWLGDGQADMSTMPPPWFYRPHARTPPGDERARALRVAGFALRRWTIGLWAALLLAWGIFGGAAGRLWSAARVLPTRLELLDLLVIQQTMLALLFLMHPSWAAGRYWVYGWLLLGGLVAWACGALWARASSNKGRALAVAVPLLLLPHYALVYGMFLAYPLGTLTRRMPSEQQVIERLQAEGLDEGIADYELVYHMLYRTDEAMTVVTKRAVNERLQENDEVLAAAIRQGVSERGSKRLFRLVSDYVQGDAYPTDDVSAREFLGARQRQGPRLVRRWRIGPYVVYEYEEVSASFR